MFKIHALGDAALAVAHRVTGQPALRAVLIVREA